MLVNLVFRHMFLPKKPADSAYVAFICCHAICFTVTWYVYIRPSHQKLEGV